LYSSQPYPCAKHQLAFSIAPIRFRSDRSSIAISVR
jgi:hypothetical protein